MLTMLSPRAKKQATAEYLRVLKPGGRLLTHDVSFTDPQAAKIIQQLQETIHVKVDPLYVDNWVQLFQETGFQKVTSQTGKMSLLSPKGMIRDEGLLSTIQIVYRGMKPENREMFKNMFSFFNKTGKELCYIAVCSTK